MHGAGPAPGGMEAHNSAIPSVPYHGMLKAPG